MRAWYETSFGIEYLRLYAHRDEEEARKDVQAIVELISPPLDEPLLDLGCGAGRHLRVFRDMGFRELVGLDLSEELLHVAAGVLTNTKSGRLNQRIHLVQADMRAIPSLSYFATALSLFTSFGYFENDEDNEEVLAAVHGSLKEGGTFLIDYLSRDHVISNLTPRTVQGLGERRISITRRISNDNRRVQKTTVVTEAGVERVFHESVRMFSADEMVTMLERTGFGSVRTYGSLAGGNLTSESRRLVLVAKKGPEA